jgi:hypothetical protein
MNYAELNTASDILEAFRLCKNPGEEIELFESLATRPNPPVTAFVEILQMIKLEPALVLTIKAFGAITDVDVKERLKQSDDLLVMLSQQANSGASDLIRWAAAMVIDTIGFDYVAISRNLPEMPSSIAEKIVGLKRKILIDSNNKSKSEQKITDRSDYKSFINFWIYGSTYDLRAITVKYCGENSSLVVEEVVKSQSIYGVKETNKLLQKAEERDYPDEIIKQVYENELFERFTHFLTLKLLKTQNIEDYNILVANLLHSLQCSNLVVRLSACVQLCNEKNIEYTNKIKCEKPQLVRIAETLFNYKNELRQDFSHTSDSQLVNCLQDLQEIIKLLSRDKAIQDCIEVCQKISKETCNRKDKTELGLYEKSYREFNNKLDAIDKDWTFTQHIINTKKSGLTNGMYMFLFLGFVFVVIGNIICFLIGAFFIIIAITNFYDLKKITKMEDLLILRQKNADKQNELCEKIKNNM